MNNQNTQTERLETEKIQLWTTSGIMLTLIKLDEAKEMVKDGRAKIISSTAISFI